MKLQAASKKEISRIAVGTLVCDVIMIAGLFLLSQFGIGKFDILRILLGAACGTVVAILNFTILCLTVQNAVETDSKKKMRRKFQMSYNLRLIIQAAWVVVAYLIPRALWPAHCPSCSPTWSFSSCKAGASSFPTTKSRLPARPKETYRSRTSRKIIPAPLKCKNCNIHRFYEVSVWKLKSMAREL